MHGYKHLVTRRRCENRRLRDPRNLPDPMPMTMRGDSPDIHYGHIEAGDSACSLCQGFLLFKDPDACRHVWTLCWHCSPLDGLGEFA